MSVNDIDSSVASDLSGEMTDFSVDSLDTDGALDQDETFYINTDWVTDYGYYNSIPEFKTAVDAKALWTMGAGFESDEITSLVLGTIKGNGKDSFNSILKNMIKVKTISRDSFAEVIRDAEGMLVNLKPLNPSSIKIVQNRMGQILRYEQVTKVRGLANKRFSPDQIFHLSHDRVADEIHGTRIIDSLGWLILARNEAMADWKTVLHRNVRPMRIWYLDTDDTAEIAAFKAKTDAASAETENIYVPKGTVETEIASVAPNATLNPMSWIDQLNDCFFQAVMVPQILFGNAKGFTDAAGKIVYLAYEQSVKAEQLYIEEQVLGQLNIEIFLTFPASLQSDMITEVEKDPVNGAAEPNDVVAEVEGQ